MIGDFRICRCCSKRRKKISMGLESLASTGGTRRTSPLSEHFCIEPEQLRATRWPRVTGQTRFLARLLDKRLRVPFPLSGDLRQQQPAFPSLFDDEPVKANGDVVERRDRLERAEQRQLDVDRRDFLRSDRRKPRI